MPWGNPRSFFPVDDDEATTIGDFYGLLVSRFTRDKKKKPFPQKLNYRGFGHLG